jgi:DNA-binding NarL/FixJ family response regulator
MSDATINDAIAPADAMHLYGNAAICGTPKARITVMLGSDRNRVLAAWLPQLEQARDFDLQGGPVSDATRIARALDRRKPKVLLLDKALFDRLPMRSLRCINRPSVAVRVLLVCDNDADDVLENVLSNRFYGLVRTDCPPDMLRKAIRSVAQGEIWLPRASLVKALTKLQPWAEDWKSVETAQRLTPRERQIVALVRHGWTNKQIARHLSIVEDTVKKHLQSIFPKLGVHRRALVVLGHISPNRDFPFRGIVPSPGS